MAILMMLTYTGAGDNAAQFAKEMQESGTVAAIREIPGNLRYEYFRPLEDPHSIVLLDAWEDQQSLDAHHASPMMQTIATLREKYDLRMSATRYQGPVDLPEGDQQFIRK